MFDLSTAKKFDQKDTLADFKNQFENNINEIYLDKLLIAFVNQPFESVPFAKLIQKMGSFANWEQMLWKQDGTSIGKQAYTCLLYTSPSPRDS